MSFLFYKASNDAGTNTNDSNEGEPMAQNSPEPSENKTETQSTPKKQEEPKLSKKKKATTKTVDLVIEHFVSSLSQVDLNKVIEREVCYCLHAYSLIGIFGFKL